MAADPCEIVVYTLSRKGDTGSEGESDVLVHARVVINGVEDQRVTGVDVKARGGEFVEVLLHVVPSSIKFISLARAEFNAETLPGES